MIDLLFFPTKWHAFENNPVIPENATLGEAVFFIIAFSRMKKSLLLMICFFSNTSATVIVAT